MLSDFLKTQRPKTDLQIALAVIKEFKEHASTSDTGSTLGLVSNSSRTIWSSSRGLATLTILNVADLWTTYEGLAKGIPEGNPLPAAMLAAYGFGALVGLKGLITLALVTAPMACRFLRHALPATCAILALVVLSNVVQVWG
jgi:hypothetical protein